MSKEIKVYPYLWAMGSGPMGNCMLHYLPDMGMWHVSALVGQSDGPKGGNALFLNGVPERGPQTVFKQFVYCPDPLGPVCLV